MDNIKLLSDSIGQISILAFGLIGYFIKRFFDLKSKRLEINHSIFQQNKLAAVSSFFKAHARAELMWNQLKIYEMLQQKLSVDDIDTYIFHDLNTLRQSTIELQIFFPEPTYKLFLNILENHYLVNGELSRLFFSDDRNEKLSTKANTYTSFRDKTMKQNSRIVDEICATLQTAYK